LIPLGGQGSDSQSSAAVKSRDFDTRTNPKGLGYYDDYDDDEPYYPEPIEDESSESSQQAHSIATAPIPNDLKPAVEQLAAALSSVPGISEKDVLSFCIDKKNWPTLKLLLKLGIAVIGVAFFVAMISHDSTMAPKNQQRKKSSNTDERDELDQTDNQNK
jgi:hypothetical protein